MKGAAEAAEEGAEEAGRPAMDVYLVADWLQGHVLTEIDGSSDLTVSIRSIFLLYSNTL